MAVTSFAHKGVEEAYRTGRSRRIGARHLKRMLLVLDAMIGAMSVVDLHNAHGFHALRGDRAGQFAMTVSENWRLVFRFEHGDRGDIVDVDFVDDH
jgi:toxin HigB-1